MYQVILGAISGFSLHAILSLDEPNKGLTALAVFLLVYITWSINKFIETSDFI